MNERRWLGLLIGILVIAGVGEGIYLLSRDPVPSEAPVAKVRPLKMPNRDPGTYRRVFKPDRLYLPTLAEKFGDTYFIVDTYNNRVIYSSALTAPDDVCR